MSDISVSVIVPVYNTIRYIHKCLDSLRLQTLDSIEFILVDDGSDDGSGEVCDKYAACDSRFKVIHQQNAGSAMARQAGIELSTGQYIIICDSDDWVDADMYESLYEKAMASSADIVLCGYIAEYGDEKRRLYLPRLNEKSGFVDNYSLLCSGDVSSVTKLVSIDFYKRSKVSYKAGINMSEDALILYKLLKENPKVVQLNKAPYHYRRQFGGTTYTNKISMEHINSLNYTYHWMCENYTEEKYQQYILRRAVDIAFACLRAKDLDKSIYDNFLREELPWAKLMERPIYLKKIFVVSQKLLPLSLSILLFKIMYPFFYK